MPTGFALIDAHCLFYRALHAPIGHLSSPSGIPTTGTFGFVRALQDAFAQAHENLSHIAVCFDPKTPTLLKKKISPEYKANRPGKSEEVSVQLNWCRQIVEAMGLQMLKVSGYEADDIIATLSTLANPKVEVVVVSSDKDLLQLVCDDPKKRVVQYDPFIRQHFSEPDVVAKWGVPPQKMLELQTITGDSTDNVKGCYGIGTKLAAKLIHRFGTAAKVKQVTHLLTPAKAKAIRESNMDLTRQLVSLYHNVPVSLELANYRAPGSLINKEVRSLFEELGFRKALKRP